MTPISMTTMMSATSGRLLPERLISWSVMQLVVILAKQKAHKRWYLQAQAAEERRRNMESNRTSMLIGTTTNSILNPPFWEPPTPTKTDDILIRRDGIPAEQRTIGGDNESIDSTGDIQRFLDGNFTTLFLNLRFYRNFCQYYRAIVVATKRGNEEQQEQLK
ncbi:uncharacterized protein BT62DRAFT_915377 [Guyanagaster necrorhizus]|uniref:Uncharacterized protein n=1 Tax=Guyanagaster necrorhizus TaxID=856835 RepID=A0A9P7W6A9_9AGAR|nr:uncharacterized protein BT62DRAFT_915377 [Guyanagaster necrorhizus MCA 3950]KAG7453044.1 hypothetical protein BT62DRAFT_915377 [Guyanagaster necrorhizus MCA 3950]